MEHLESVEEARYMVEQANKEIDIDQIGIQMDAAFEQDQVDCYHEGSIPHPEYIHLDKMLKMHMREAYSRKLIFLL